MFCKCGCGNDAETKGGWVKYHWNSTIQARSRNSVSNRGRIAWNVGISPSQSTRDKQSKKLLGRPSPNKNPDVVGQKAKVVAGKAIRSFLNRMMRNGGSKRDRDSLGYSWKELKEHLEKQFKPGMSWENHGRGGWHIDHIHPICQFPLGASSSEVNRLSNLRPLWEKENLTRPRKLKNDR